jgi:outer membrane protein assembly factor BamA
MHREILRFAQNDTKNPVFPQPMKPAPFFSKIRFCPASQITYYVSVVKHFSFAFISLSFLLFTALAVRAQAPPANAAPSSTIAAITVTGAKKIPVDQIVTASGLKAGDVVTAARIQEATDQLAALGIFSQVNFRYTSKGDAINLEFQVQEAPTYRISFDNFPWFTATEIGDAIRKNVGLFTGESPDSGTIIDQMTGVIEDLLASRKIKGTVTHQLVSMPVGDGMEMQFRLEGVQLRVQSVQFGDPAATSSERLRDRVSDVKGQPYSIFAVELFESEQVRPLYVSKGFLRAQIGPPETHLVPDMNDPKDTAVELLIPIHPGDVYTWKGVSWQGNSAIPSSSLDADVQLKPGDVADGMKIEAQWRKVEAEYKRQGYLDMKLSDEAQFDEAAHQVSHRVTIVEGPQYRMGAMIITGLSLDAEKRLREAWQTTGGQVFDDVYYEDHVKILSKPSRAIFGDLPVHYNEFGHLLRPDATRHTVDVLLDFK